MAKEIGGARDPGDPGCTVGQIDTPMCDKNVDRKNTPKTHDYSNTMNLDAAGGSRGALKTDGKIEGPGMKGAYPNKGMKGRK